jgi:hypothetical protein
MMRRSMLAGTAVAALLCSAPVRADGPDPLLEGFKRPPAAARPRTWWHWTGGNITKDGIDKDLDWMHRVGIGGFQLADVQLGGGQSVEPKVSFGTPEWYSAVRHAAERAQSLNLEMSIFSSAGWSLAGGPWVTPDHAMKRLVWSETDFTGGRAVSLRLPLPPANAGPVRDLDTHGDNVTAGRDAPFYRDSAVVAYRLPAVAAAPKPVFTASNGQIDATPLSDDSLNTAVTLPAGPGWIMLRYPTAFTARALSLGVKGGIPVGALEASDDGATWRTIVSTPGAQGYHGAAIRTFAFPAIAARFFRLRLDGPALTPAQVINWAPSTIAKPYVLTELKLLATPTVDRWEDKGAFGSLMDDYSGVPTPDVAAGIGEVVDISRYMAADGTLRWTPPTGRWQVLRFGYANTGARNRPSVPAGSGLEVDKLNGAYVADYVRGYLDPLQKALGPLVGQHPSYVTMDSWEAGMQNWTDDMVARFKARRGYDPTPYLPVLAGHVVKSAEISDRFLWDFRRTLADLYADEFYGTMASEFRRRGLNVYAEASGVALEIPEDTLRNKSKVAIPMAEFWVTPLHPFSEYYADVRGAASAGHVFAKPIVAAEAFTGGWYESPYTLKKVADYWFAQGVNRLVFHSTAIQPLDTRPGNTMVGTHINRNITWAEQARPFMDYVARNDFMLQQGRFVADVAYLLPEGAPATIPFWGAGLKPALPDGYDYDVMNTDVLLHDARVEPDGHIRLASGMRYRILVLPASDEMSVAVIRKLAEMTAAGAWIVGARPHHSTGLADYPHSDVAVQAIAERLWGGLDGIANTQRPVGKGMVNWGLPLADVLRRAGEIPDAEIAGGVGAKTAWLHRTLADADVYYVASQKDVPQAIEARFRVTGKSPELWDPVTGQTRAASYRIEKGATVVRFDLAERQSQYVVFRKPAVTLAEDINRPAETLALTLDGPWSVTFAGPGAPAEPRTLARLASWTEQADAAARYFSGAATYSRTISLSAKQRGKGKMFLDLGDVRDMASVRVNGVDCGFVWAPPFRVDVTDALRSGRNVIAVEVTNEWTNRVEGDRQDPAHAALAGSANIRRFFNDSHDLPPSGLLGPVRLVARE